MIKVEHIYKSFGDLHVLNDVCLHVEKGERIAIIGPSGCGKSVFLRSIANLAKPDSGRVVVMGENITDAKGKKLDAIRRRMGMVYQGFHLFEHLTVLENITLAPIKILHKSKEEAVARATELLRTVGLESKKNAMPSDLSGGQKQRVAIARCLAMDPEVMLFDEPTSALDPTMVGEVLATIRALARREMTMLIVTHEMNFAYELATRILYMDEGGIYEQGTPDEIFKNPKKPKTTAFIKKFKYYGEHIDERAFDLMRISGGITQFCRNYGIDGKTDYRLQLCAEELIYDLIANCYAPDEKVDINIAVEYSEADRSITFELSSAGREYNPFAADKKESEEEIRLGVSLLSEIAKSIEYKFEDERNKYKFVL